MPLLLPTPESRTRRASGRPGAIEDLIAEDLGGSEDTDALNVDAEALEDISSDSTVTLSQLTIHGLRWIPAMWDRPADTGGEDDTAVAVDGVQASTSRQ